MERAKGIVSEFEAVFGGLTATERDWLIRRIDTGAKDWANVALSEENDHTISALNEIAPAVENLSRHQEQCDMDGVMVKVSRQALDEVLGTINALACSLSTRNAFSEIFHHGYRGLE